MFKLFALVIAVFTGFVFLSSAFASEAPVPVSVEQEEWYPLSVGPLTTWTAPFVEKGKLLIQPFVFYNRTRGTFDADGHYNKLPKGDRQSQYQEQLFVEYGITDNLELSGQIVYQQNMVKNEEGRAHARGFGDSYLYLRYLLNAESKLLPDIVGMLQVKAPTGKYQHLDSAKLGTDSMGTGSWDPGIGFIMTKRIKPFILHADAVYSFPQKVQIDGVNTRYADYLCYDLGVEYFLPKGFNLIFELNGYLQADTKQDGELTPSTNTEYLTLAPGIGWSCDKLQLLLAYQRVVAGINADANDSVVLTGTYTF
jgi:hypothetical protein